ncbi:hypothetical protein GCM10023321_22470 [Pseudonocardia eucalypti]|uniref:DUF3558 domain-containing protein n=1 Tax=Pseudonocardia eucalypti TaxID=648755 RepID=A0ABP9PX53_9PSEU|nr:hypothetical protein [Pseudonocardia eucalypti]
MTRARWFLITVGLLVAAGCNSPAGGPIPEQPADWALAEFDPCAPLHGEPGSVRLSRPHTCELERPAGRLTVRVAAPFGTATRLASAPVAVAGLVGYQRRFGGRPSCRVDLPISATRAIEMAAPDPTGGCAEARALAERAARMMRRPATASRRGPADGLARRTACDLLRTVPGVEVWEPTGGREDEPAGADSCAGKLADQLGYLSLETSYAPAPDTAERLGEGDPSCTVADGGVVLTIGNGGCEEARRAMDHVRRALFQPAPPAPPAPPRLGITLGDPDDVRPLACGVQPTDLARCRAPRPVAAPVGREALLATAAHPSPEAADQVCAMLRDAPSDLFGSPPTFAAAPSGACLVATDAGLRYSLRFESVGDARCQPGSEGVQVAGRPGCRAVGAIETLRLTAHEPVSLVVEAGIQLRGEPDAPPDRARLAGLVDRITAHVVRVHLRA